MRLELPDGLFDGLLLRLRQLPVELLPHLDVRELEQAPVAGLALILQVLPVLGTRRFPLVLQAVQLHLLIEQLPDLRLDGADLVLAELVENC